MARLVDKALVQVGSCESLELIEDRLDESRRYRDGLVRVVDDAGLVFRKGQRARI